MKFDDKEKCCETDNKKCCSGNHTKLFGFLAIAVISGLIALFSCHKKGCKTSCCKDGKCDDDKCEE